MIWCDTAGETTQTGHRPVSVNVENREQLLTDIEKRLSTRQGFSVATLNLDHVVKLNNSAEFRDAYRRQTYVTADGNPIVWLTKLAGQSLRLVPGSELVDPVSDIAASLDIPVAFLGSSEESLAEAERILSQRYPGLRVVARISPPMGFDPTGQVADEAIETLSQTGARLVFLSLGAPKQEIFAARAQEQLSETGFLSIGAGLDFISGVQTRAPKLVRRLASEWLWRLAQNPTRFAKRYLDCIVILPRLVQHAMRSRQQIRGKV